VARHGWLILAVFALVLSDRAFTQEDVRETARKDLQALIAARESLPPLKVEAVFLTHKYPHSELNGTRVESTLVSDGKRFLIFWDEKRPNGVEMPHHSAGCAFDGTSLRWDPWGKRDYPASREAFAAHEFQFDSVDAAREAGRLSTCGWYDHRWLGYQLGYITETPLIHDDRTGPMPATYIHRMLEMIDDELNWITTRSPLAGSPDYWTCRCMSKSPNAGYFQAMEVDYSRTSERVMRLENMYAQSTETLYPGMHGGGQLMTCEWDGSADALLPSKCVYKRTEPDLRFHYEFQIKAEVVPESALAPESLGWSSLNLPIGRIAFLDEKIPHVSTWNGKAWQSNAIDGPLQEMPGVSVSGTGQGRSFRILVLIANGGIGAMLMLLYIRSRRRARDASLGSL
jgi:hypothetical protein